MIAALYLACAEALGLSHTPLRLLAFTESRLAFAFLTAFALVLICGPRIIRWLWHHGVRDQVRPYDASFGRGKGGTPTMGGLLLLVGLIASALIWCNPLATHGHPSGAPLLLIAALAFGALGAVDDLAKLRGRSADAGLSRSAKLIAQALFGGLLAWFVLDVRTSPLEESFSSVLFVPYVAASDARIDLGIFAWPTMVLAFVGISNAVNFADGLDGLAAGPTAVVMLVLTVFAYAFSYEPMASAVGFPHLPGMAEVAVFLSAATGAVIAFLWFNGYPAQVFMGDTGAMALGGTVATAVILTKSELIFFVVGAVFIYEFLSVLIQDSWGIRRLGRRIFFRAPAHHAFRHRGLAEPKVVLRFWIVSLGLGVLALSALKLR